jgi:Ca-activated chloride channel homolog
MKRRLAIRILIVAGAVACLSRLPGKAPHQEPIPQQEAQDFVIHSDVRLVLLDVAVKDRNGALVKDLAQDNFTVFENGQPQTITSFANQDVPVTVGILVDESRSMTPKRNAVLEAAGAFIHSSNPSDQIFVLNFNDNVRRGLPPDMLFSDNMDQLRAALDRGVPRGMTALNDAVVEGLDQLKLGRQAKKALVLISDGGDNASHNTRAAMYDMVERSTATIYTVGLLDPTDTESNPQILKHLASVSGGEAFFLEDSDGLTPICEGIAKEIRTRYTIGYQPKPDNHGPLRRVEVRVSAPGRRLMARTRKSYRYQDLNNANTALK